MELGDSFYRLYVHYLYFFEILPAKNEYIELSPDYYKQKRKNNMIFEEINFLARHSFTSVYNVTKYQENLSNKLPKLKGKREILWRKHKSADTNKKAEILEEINLLTEKIDKIQAQKNACIRIISRYENIKQEYLKQIKNKEKANELAILNKGAYKKQR